MNDYLSMDRSPEYLDVSDIRRQRRGLTYTAPDGSARPFDLYYPNEGDGPFPLIVNISGGGWFYGHPTSAHLGGTLHASVRRGYAFASIACTSSKYRKFPYQIREAKQVLRHLRRHAAELNLDTGFFAFWSFSSGGHLSLMAALTPDDGFLGDPSDVPCTVDALAVMYPCCRLEATEADFRAIGLEPENYHSGLRSAEAYFLGVAAEDAPELCRRADPISYLRPDVPPVMLLHGTGDRVVPYSTSLEFALRYREVVGSEKLLTRFIPGAEHSDPVFKSDAMCAEVLDFLDRVRLGQLPCPPERQGVDL